MRLGVNVPNFGPGTNPDVLRRWALTVQGLPFTTLAWLAGFTRRVRLGTTVLIVPCRHPLLVARIAANLFNGDHRETAHPQEAWRALAAVAERWGRTDSGDKDPERS